MMFFQSGKDENFDDFASMLSKLNAVSDQFKQRKVFFIVRVWN